MLQFVSENTTTGRSAGAGPKGGGLDGFFKITERGSTLAREIRGGVVTFFTMAYIIVLNPLILGFAPDADGNFLGGGPGDGSNLAAIAAGTALVAGVMTILMGVVANYPLALAAGLGLNAFVAFAIASQMTWADAMGLVVLEGLVILVLVLTGFRDGGLPRRARAAQDRDLGRHRPVHRPDRPRRRRLRPPDPGRRQQPRPGPAGPRRAAGRVAGVRVRDRPRAAHRPVGAAGQGRDPDLDPRDDGARDRRGGDRRVRLGRRQPHRLVPQRAGAAGQDRRRARLRHARRVLPARVVRRPSASSPRCSSCSR